jgi:hypothetical protein
VQRFFGTAVLLLDYDIRRDMPSTYASSVGHYEAFFRLHFLHKSNLNISQVRMDRKLGIQSQYGADFKDWGSISH